MTLFTNSSECAACQKSMFSIKRYCIGTVKNNINKKTRSSMHNAFRGDGAGQNHNCCGLSQPRQPLFVGMMMAQANVVCYV